MFKGITLVKWSHQDGQAGMLRPGALMVGILWALMATVFICAALALWVLLTAGVVYHFSGILTAGVLLGVFIGGALGGGMAGRMGWLHGLIVGLVYSCAVVAFMAVWNEGLSAFLELAGRCAALMLAATIGGIVGVNLPVLRRSRRHTRAY